MRLINAGERWMYGTAQMAALYERLDDAAGMLVAFALAGVADFKLSGLEDDSHKKPHSPRLITGRLLLKIRLPEVSSSIRLISIRRRRLRPIAFAEAARRVFRGRAPPHAAICPL
ncbi:MAG TPA: hypothetical protein VGQ65_06135 [Thermoanaerobaculia bacterium]|nr:hypothetical protein [Thermoanaerobaculia bacterium]